MPALLPSIVPLAPTPDDLDSGSPAHAPNEVVRDADAPLGGGTHLAFRGQDDTTLSFAPVRAWLLGTPLPGTSLAAVLPLDGAFPVRLRAAHRLWRLLNGLDPGRAPDFASPHRRRRLALALRSLDACLDGASYRAVAVALFGAARVPGDAAWRHHDLRSRTVRLVQDGLAIMRGGYARLLRNRTRS